ncbi:lipid II flippase MurJ [Granulicella sibirica]|uniref:Integral membrane protein MviN n=1 Tax=Granulicella sibirica TaxID=2479048 RepID=A0A4V1L523_9BACT|nr:lipid II flippase MurJ [Granulicella sibirica]RXH54264.1 integral membrane protein MviN [Granulicella sibirica]
MPPTEERNPPQQALLARLGVRTAGKGVSAYAATLLLMSSSLLSGFLGLIRTSYINSTFANRTTTDAYNAAFQLPDMISYFLIGGVASISLITILNRYRATGDEDGADQALSVVLNAMFAVLATAIVIAEIFAPLYTRAWFPGFDAATAALCTHLTRIILPGQLFFFAGGVLGSRLLVRKIFVYQALTPIVYNLGIIAGGVLLSSRLGIDSVAWGVLGGSLVGPGILNALGAFRGGFRFHPVLDLFHPAFREWLKMSLPLMIGVSVAMADKWILAHYSASNPGGITRLSTAKMLFNAPLSVIGIAAGAASQPFFSSLFAQGRLYDFNGAVTRAVSRLLAASFLLSAWMIALADPIVDLLRRRAFTQEDARSTAHFFGLFAITLCFWASQGIYSRAFYAAGNTLTPAISGTLVTIISVPVYALLYTYFGLDGLAIASDIAIFAMTLTLAIQLHRKRVVSIASLENGELLRAAFAAVVAYFGITTALRYLPHPTTHAGDMGTILAATIVWLVLTLGVLLATGSRLPKQLITRR